MSDSGISLKEEEVKDGTAELFLAVADGMASDNSHGVPER